MSCALGLALVQCCYLCVMLLYVFWYIEMSSVADFEFVMVCKMADWVSWRVSACVSARMSGWMIACVCECVGEWVN